MNKILLEVKGISYSQSTTNAFALLLGENTGKRRLPIIIGQVEAQAIVMELENIKPPRPLTHDLFVSFAKEFNISMQEAFIDRFIDGVFYAKIIFSDGTQEKVVDSRTSDAVALALRFRCPIYTTEEIMDATSFELNDDDTIKEAVENDDVDDDTKSPAPENATEYYNMSIDELEKLLKIAVEREEYEKASLIRDEIQRKKSKKK